MYISKYESKYKSYCSCCNIEISYNLLGYLKLTALQSALLVDHYFCRCSRCCCSCSRCGCGWSRGCCGSRSCCWSRSWVVVVVVVVVKVVDDVVVIVLVVVVVCVAFVVLIMHNCTLNRTNVKRSVWFIAKSLSHYIRSNLHACLPNWCIWFIIF